jgi:hypothetical protein
VFLYLYIDIEYLFFIFMTATLIDDIHPSSKRDITNNNVQSKLFKALFFANIN